MDINKFVFQELEKKGIFISPETLRSHIHQGFMSSVSVADSNIGKVIIHIATLVRDHQQNKVWEKFSGLKELLSVHSDIPTPRVYFSGLVDEKFVLVQKFSEGKQAGRRIINDNVILDLWNADKDNIIKKILSVLAAVHQIKLEGFGWPILKNGVLTGRYISWRDFFNTESSHWMKVIAETDVRLGLQPILNLESFVKNAIEAVNYNGPASLVHGDAINPSNILVKDDKEIVLLDWEWSIAGDPAWEFGDLGWWSVLNKQKLSPYFKARNITSLNEQEDFLSRARLSGFFWLLWGTHMHGHDENPNIYLALRKLLIERVIAKEF